MRIFSSLFGGLVLSAAMAQPCAGFQACFVPSGVGSSSVFFNNCSPNEGSSQFVWSFGDGAESTLTAPTHEFAAPGEYEVCLTAYWQDCVDSTCTIITVVGGDPCLQLNADFSWTSGPNGVQFSNGTTGTGVSTSFAWSFGDGSTSNDAQPNHSYTEPGAFQVCLVVLSMYPGQDGMITCTAEHCALVQVGVAPPCDPNFAVALATTNISGNVVQFAATSNHANTYFNWYFGDGTEGYGNTETHAYAGGTYTVCITGWYYNELAQDSCWAEACTVLTVEGGVPCADLESCFQPSQLSETAFFFNNCSSPSLESSFVWDFGDGTTSTSFAPIHTYSQAAVYWVCLTGTWPGGCTVESCSELVVGGDPCSGLDACFVVNELQQPGTFFFDNCTQGPTNTQFVWDFGDGGTSSGTNVDHFYAAPGTYTVCLTAYSQNCSDNTCTTITIGEGNPCDALDPNFSSSAAGLGVNFANVVITNAWSYLWNFGDGTEGYGPNPYHTYAEPGAYQVCLVVYTWDPIAQDTCFADHCTLLTVTTSDPCSDLDACFVTNDLGNNTFFFDNCTTGPIGIQYTWDFGDGTVSTVTNTEHHFLEPGAYTVCLIAVWQNCTDQACTEVLVNVTDPCVGLGVDFSWNTSPNGTLFSNGTTGAGFQTSFTWDFGDGGSSSDAQPSHTYSGPGTYTVCLQVLTIYELAGGGLHTCLESTCNIVTIGGGDPCDLLDACIIVSELGNDSFLFENCSSIIEGAQFVWDFGDGAQESSVIADHHYQAPGMYTACLTAYWENCVDSTCTTLLVEGGGLCDSLVACFEPQPFENGVYFFSNCSQILPIDIPANYSWDFGDGTTSDAIQPEHVFAPGTYTVCLIVAHSDCIDSTCTTIKVGGFGCNPDFACTFTYDVQGTAVIFFGTANQDVNGVVWELGDGTEGYTNILTHLYEPPGPFEVCFSAWYWNEAEQDTCWTEYCALVDPFSVGIADAANTSINVFPIPASDVIHVSGLTANTQLQLFTLDGRLVFDGRASSSIQRIPVAELAPASYVLRLDMEGRVFYRKVMVE